MEKTELMKRYEAETGEILDIDHLSADANGSWYGYIDELEAKANISDEAIKAFQKIIRNQCDEITALKEKAEAYDRLMSGGKVSTAKEVANFYGRPVASVDREWKVFENLPQYDGYRWWDMKSRAFLSGETVQFNIDAFEGDEKDSLTLPDGWEEA